MGTIVDLSRATCNSIGAYSALRLRRLCDGGRNGRGSQALLLTTFVVIHILICLIDQLVKTELIVRRNPDRADAQRQLIIMRASLRFDTKAFLQAADNSLDLMARNVLRQYCKLIAAEAADNIRVSKGLLQDRGRPGNREGAFAVPEGIVDFFEPIHVRIE